MACELALVLAAFWYLLGFQASAETYATERIVPTDLDLAWFGASGVAAIVSLAVLRSKRGTCRIVARGLVPVVAASSLVALSGWAGHTLHCWHMILFGAAAGWSATRLAKRFGKNDGGLDGVSAWHMRGVLAVVLVGLSAFYFWQQVRSWNNLALGFSDVGEMARQMFNTFHHPRTLFMALDENHPIFWDHFQPGVLPFFPLWWVWPDLRLLIVFQIVAIAGTAVPIYLLGQHCFRDSRSALLLALVWLVYPSTSQLIYNASFGFRWGSFCLPLFFVALLLWLKHRNGWAIAIALWAMLIKEEAAILVGMFGLYLFLFRKPRWAGLVVAGIAFGYFFAVTSLLMPAWNEGRYVVQSYFSDLGSTKSDLLFAPFTRPTAFWGKLLTPNSIYLAAVVLAPLLFLPLRKPSVLIIGLLTFVFVCLLNHPLAKSICYQYHAGLLPVVFWAFVCALESTPGFQSAAPRRAALLGALVAGITLSVFLGNSFWSKPSVLVDVAPDRLELVRRFASRIDSAGTLVASQRVAAHFIHQNHLVLAPQLPAATDHVLLDLRGRWRPEPGVGWLREMTAFQRKVESRGDLHLVGAEDGLILYARHAQPLDAEAWVTRPGLPGNASHLQIDLGSGLKVIGFTASVEPRSKATVRVRITAFSVATRPTTTERVAQCIVRYRMESGEVESYASAIQPLGHGIWPTTRWLPGKTYADDFLLPVPAEFENAPFDIEFAPTVLADRGADREIEKPSTQ